MSTPDGRVDFTTVHVEDVSRHFGRRRALSRVSFQAGAGCILGLLGPNGAGKSTMLGILATLMTPTSGRLRFGERVVGRDGATLARVRARIGVLGHDLFLYPELTARENLTFFAGLYDVEGPREAAQAALERAGLAARADEPLGSFSRGMRQRIALERALLHEPRLVLLDEPFTGLDDASTAMLVARLRLLRGQGAIVIVATHDLDLAEGVLDDAIVLRDGRVVETLARPQQLRAAYRAIIAGR